MRVVERRLGNDPDPIAFRFEQAADQSGAKAGVVDVGVAADEQKIEFIPAARLHILLIDGQKSHSLCIPLLGAFCELIAGTGVFFHEHFHQLGHGDDHLAGFTAFETTNIA